MKKRRFADLSPAGRAVLTALAVVQVGLLVAAEADLARRPAAQVRGSKTGWRLISLVNVFGPLAYFRWGRRPA